MVMLDPESEAALKRGNRVVFEEPGLNKLTRDIVPPAVRISIPLDNRYRLRAVAKILAGLATRLEALTHWPTRASRQYLSRRAWKRG